MMDKKQKRDAITQMADAIAKEAPSAAPEEQKRIALQRKRLTGRAMEYFMFMDDEDEQKKGG